jgi:HAD superfamily hydrolase (TIGR01509 family)
MKAVIFDMDGVIADTQVVHATVESNLLREYGISLTPAEITRQYAGVNDNEFWPDVFTKAGKPAVDPRTLTARKWEIMYSIDSGTINPMPGSLELINELFAGHVPLAVASSSPKRFIELVVDTLAVREKFSTLVSGDDVEHGKPAPDIFLLAAKQIGINATECVVIEDGLSGMVATKRAGMRCVGLLTHVSESESPADVNVHDLRDLALEMLGIADPK